ncbi:MAG: tRNA lysidine(34) synthetase TilS [Clostridiales bacterium]|jgi:tRNA(Ile)-lysidine synthase|nr:tRNA lysidine(34) synthetase TilS [Clostridiales bacterium]
MSFLERVKSNIITKQLIKPAETVAAAVSGGQDSMALLFALSALKDDIGFELIAVNVEHGIRGEESLKDSLFVRNFCAKRGIELHEFSFDIPTEAKYQSISVEECARNKRYEAFAELLNASKCQKIALAHHAGDQAETIFMRILRGTGVAGLSGMRDIRDGEYIRPLLDISRGDIESFISDNNIPYVTDTSNADNEYTRNFIRNEVFPLIATRFKGFENALLRLGKNAGEMQFYIEKQSKSHGIELRGSTAKVPEQVLAESVSAKAAIDICFGYLGVLRDVENRHSDEIKKLLIAANGASLDMPFGITAVREYGYITFYRADSGAGYRRESVKIADILSTGGIYGDGNTEISLKTFDVSALENGFFDAVNGSKGLKKLYADIDKISDGAVLRYPESGDVFKKLGGGTKKLCDYFTDSKTEKRLRNGIPVIAYGNNILAVTGREISDTVKIDETTKWILEIEIHIKG